MLKSVCDAAEHVEEQAPQPIQRLKEGTFLISLSFNEKSFASKSNVRAFCKVNPKSFMRKLILSSVLKSILL